MREVMWRASLDGEKNHSPGPTLLGDSGVVRQFALVTRRPYCPGRPEKLCVTTLSLAVETRGVRLGVVKQSFFGLPGQYGRRVTRAN